MSEPGTRLLRVARRLCGPSSVERVLAPAVADLRHEWRAAAAAGARGRAAWIRLTGTIRIAQALLFQGAIDAWRGPVRPVARDLALPELGLFTLAACVLLSLALASPARLLGLFPEYGIADKASVLALLAPAALVAFLPAGLLPGALLAMRRGRGEPTLGSALRLAAASCLVAGAALGLAGWVMPAANDALVTRLAAVRVIAPRVEKGPRELTIAELNQRVAAIEAGSSPGSAARFRVERHKRFALPAGAWVFALLAFALARRGLGRRVASALALTVLTIWIQLVLYRIGEGASRDLLLAPVGVWLANATLTIAAVALLVRRARTSSEAAAA